MKIPKFKFSFNFDKERGRLTIKPYRDWAIILATFSVLLLLLVFYNISLFQRFARVGEIGLEDIVKTQVKIISERDLNSVIGEFDHKGAFFNSYYSSRPSIVDPAK